MMKDKNGKELRTGLVVKVSGAYTKNNNGLFLITHSEGDACWTGNYYSLKKIKNNGEFSTAKYSTSSLPLAYYSNNSNYNITAREHDEKNLEIEVVEISDYSHISEYFRNEIENMNDQIEYSIQRGFSESADWIVEYKKRIAEYEKIINEHCELEKEPQKELNNMCPNCACLGVDCSGTYEAVWTGCIYRKTKTEKEQPKEVENEQPQEKATEQQETAQEAEKIKQTEELPTKEENPLVAYYTVNEQTARTAKHLNSFSDYKDGEAATIYRQYVDNAAELAKMQIEKYPEEEEKILYYLDKYAKKLANWYNDYYRNEAACPSILISGGSNFPVRKKEKQNSRRDTLYSERQYIDGILDKIKGIGILGIKAGDANAIEKLEKKIVELEADHKRKMAINNYYKKNGTLDGCELMTEKEIKKTMDFIERYPFFPPCITCNDTQNIRRYKERLESLKKAKANDTSEEENKHCKVMRNTEIMRIQLLFNGKPDEETRNILKSNGFRWAPSQSAWQRNLNSNGECAVKRVLQELDKMTA